MSEGIQGKVVVITGASGGLGETTARHLAKGGAKLVLGARHADKLQALAAELGQGPDAAVATDVTKLDDVKHLVDVALRLHGRVDVMLNNARLMQHSPLQRLKVEDWGRMIDVNFRGAHYGVAARDEGAQARIDR